MPVCSLSSKGVRMFRDLCKDPWCDLRSWTWCRILNVCPRRAPGQHLGARAPVSVQGGVARAVVSGEGAGVCALLAPMGLCSWQPRAQGAGEREPPRGGPGSHCGGEHSTRLRFSVGVCVCPRPLHFFCQYVK